MLRIEGEKKTDAAGRKYLALWVRNIYIKEYLLPMVHVPCGPMSQRLGSSGSSPKPRNEQMKTVFSSFPGPSLLAERAHPGRMRNPGGVSHGQFGVRCEKLPLQVLISPSQCIYHSK